MMINVAHQEIYQDLVDPSLQRHIFTDVQITGNPVMFGRGYTWSFTQTWWHKSFIPTRWELTTIDYWTIGLIPPFTV